MGLRPKVKICIVLSYQFLKVLQKLFGEDTARYDGKDQPLARCVLEGSTTCCPFVFSGHEEKVKTN